MKQNNQGEDNFQNELSKPSEDEINEEPDVEKIVEQVEDPKKQTENKSETTEVRKVS